MRADAAPRTVVDECVDRAIAALDRCAFDAREDAELMCTSSAKVGVGIWPDGRLVQPGEEQACSAAYATKWRSACATRFEGERATCHRLDPGAACQTRAELDATRMCTTSSRRQGTFVDLAPMAPGEEDACRRAWVSHFGAGCRR